MKIKYIILLIAILCTTGAVMAEKSSNYYRLPAIEFADLDYGYPVNEIQIANVNLAYIDQGQGSKTLLLIHGLGSYARAWAQNIDVLARQYRVIAVDLPGYGKSSKGHYDYSMDFNAAVLRDFINLLKLEHVTLIGHSMGGQIAMTLALESPELVENLVLISPAGFERFEEGEAAWMKDAMTPELVRDTPIRSIDKNLRINFYDAPPGIEYMITDRIQMRLASDFYDYCYAVSKNVEGMLRGIVWDRLGKIKQPTLILFGENDELIPNRFLHPGWTKDVAEIGKKEIPNSTLIMVPKCGHFVQANRPEIANQAIMDFIK